MKPKRWVLFSVSALLILSALCAGTVYLVDPFEQYRESAILPLYDQESYNNPGIVKNYDYDAVILGTSMVEMSHPSVIDSCFGVHSVKLPMRGSYSPQMGWQLRHVLKQRDLKLAILEVDPYSLLGNPNDTDELFDYLWNDDPLDDIHYLLNRDVLLVRVPKMLKNIGKPLDNKRDDMYQWTDVTFSEESVLNVVPYKEQQDMQPANGALDRITENIRTHIEPYIQAYPEISFKIYMPPYSAGYWYLMTRGGLSEQYYRARARLCELLLPYENVEIYDFASRTDWILNLDNYFDASHHSGAISDALMQDMAEGQCRVLSVSDMEEGSERIRRAVDEFAKKYGR